MTITVRGVALDLDLADAEMNARYLAAFERYQQDVAALPDGGSLGAEGIRQVCRTVFALFNDLFGAGTDRRVFGDACNLREAMTGLSELVDAATAQRRELDELLAGIAAKYGPGRSVRTRAKA